MCTSSATPAAAQLAPVGLPRGVFRIELGGEFRHADSRFLDGETADFARPFTTLQLGGQFYAPLLASEADRSG